MPLCRLSCWRCSALSAGALLFTGLALPIPSRSAPPPTVYVATDGNDAWSGRLPAPNREGTDGPLATLARRIRELLTQRQEGTLALPFDR